MAGSYSKSVIFAATLGVIFNYFTSSEATVISSVIFWVVWGLFGTSLFIALPFYALHVYIVAAKSGHTEFLSGIPKDTAGKILGILSTVVLLTGKIIAVLVSIWLLAYLEW